MSDFQIDGVTFRQRIGTPDERGESANDSFVLVKTDQMLDFYRDLRNHDPRTIMEVGMYEGGSLVWFDKIFKPEMLAGLDVRREPIDALEAYRRDRAHIATYYGRYQENIGTLQAARECFPDGIDLVVDDASHLYEQTKATFEMIFPLMRPGGHYVIEDWAWAHTPSRQEAGTDWFGKSALTNLVFELTVLAARVPAIDSIQVLKGMTCVRRGNGSIPVDLFDLSPYLRGRSLPSI
jgi:hypothetical protein